MKRYGIRITLPEDSTLRAPHLLGPEWESFRWFDSEGARERALAEMSRTLPNYRRGDHVSQVLERVEREA
ncbi:hypothetical protein [Thioalkalivibrio paradoxus]|uniref:Uncharacterized protein n=1 Tax=Thioalkalivibrio paradoxus ARh 1 TaxID=713585 RepID=W0DM20_9GAMM|nr:hypothetical protein [Thioalkalivibrio paradoxus]AHE99501.1 hypothetical protein THITH_15790 [Thioalkalivibrio paradoxus ARh 1]